jgi:hypothetical protein
MILTLIRKTFAYKIWLKFRVPIVEAKIVAEWEDSGKPSPPPHLVKFREIKKYQKINSASVLIETGTYKGAMLDSCQNLFEKLYSIELDQKLYDLAQEKYNRESKISILQGDSGIELEKLLKKINEPCLFWLDGHYSAGITAKADLDTPIINELKSIFNHRVKNHVILIDDARLFVGKNDYPTIEGLKEIVNEYDSSKVVIVDFDIITIY